MVAPSEPAPLPPRPPCLRMRSTATGVEFRPLPRPLGRFRLFVLLIVDLTRIQPNSQRTVLLPNRLVLLTAFPRCILCPRRVCHRFMVPVCAPLLLVFRTSLSAWCHGACYACCFMYLCGGVWRRRALQSRTGDVAFFGGWGGGGPAS